MLSSLYCYQVYRACLTVDKADMAAALSFYHWQLLRYLSGSRSQNQISMKTDDVARCNSIGTCCSLPTVLCPGDLVVIRGARNGWPRVCCRRYSRTAYSPNPRCHSRVHTIQRLMPMARHPFALRVVTAVYTRSRLCWYDPTTLEHSSPRRSSTAPRQRRRAEKYHSPRGKRARMLSRNIRSSTSVVPCACFPRSRRIFQGKSEGRGT
jgi:hypothetical protein